MIGGRREKKSKVPELVHEVIHKLHAAPNLTETNFETPGSCMVTP
jgi:hypothetical protein